MNKTSLFNKMLRGEKIDRTLFRPILMHFAARFSGYTYGQLASDYKVLVDANIKAMEHFDLDMVGLISDPYRETSAFGAKIEFIPEGVPKCLNKIITSMDDVENLKIPDVYLSERTRDRIEGAKLYQKLLQGNVPVIGWIEGPLAEACDLGGVSEMMMSLMMDPDLCHRLMDKCVVVAKAFAQAQIEEGCQIIGVGDAVCSQIDGSTYREFVFNRHKEIIDHIHEKGGMVKLHICGDITHLLPAIAELNVDILDCDSGVDLDYAYEILGPDVVRTGNIFPVKIQDLSEEKVYEVTKQLVDKEMGKKYILSAGCEITVNTPPENLMAMRRASMK